MIPEVLSKIVDLNEKEYSDLVVSSKVYFYKVRLILIDKSFIDISIPSKSFKNRFNFHWERRHLDNTFYRYDNFPNTKWKKIKGYPYHFHCGSQDKVAESKFGKKIIKGFGDFMEFVRIRLNEINKNK